MIVTNEMKSPSSRNMLFLLDGLHSFYARHIDQQLTSTILKQLFQLLDLSLQFAPFCRITI